MDAIVETPVGFADSELIRYSRDSSTCEVWVKTWKETVLEITFSDAAGLFDFGTWCLSDFVVGEAEDPWSRRAVANTVGELPAAKTMKAYKFIDLDGEVGLLVVAAKVSISELTSQPQD